MPNAWHMYGTYAACAWNTQPNPTPNPNPNPDPNPNPNPNPDPNPDPNPNSDQYGPGNAEGYAPPYFQVSGLVPFSASPCLVVTGLHETTRYRADIGLLSGCVSLQDITHGHHVCPSTSLDPNRNNRNNPNPNPNLARRPKDQSSLILPCSP